MIPDTDVRKGWWINASLESPLLDHMDWDGVTGSAISSLAIPNVKRAFQPYTNVKFAPYENKCGTDINAGDWCIMRAEEMLLIQAEAMAMAFGKVYTFGPTFRAEKSFTTRHAAEFWMIEPEMAFCDLNGYMDTAEAMTKYVIRYVLDNCPDEMAFFNQFIDKGLIERLELVANSEFGRISYTEAIEILKKNNKKFQFPVEWGVDIQTEHERYLTEVVFKKPVFVTDYPKEIKSFYMKQNPDGKTVAAADMLVPGIGELIGGSQREENYDKLVARMDELGMDKTNYDWYLNLRKFGGVEHAGYGLGFERMIMYLTGIQNIRDVLPFPRTAYGF